MTRLLHRRTLIGSLLVGSGAMVAGCRPALSAMTSTPRAQLEKLEKLEKEVGGRVGVVAFSPASGQVVAHRPDARFAMCSTFKWALAAVVLEEVAAGRLTLSRRLAFTNADIEQYAPAARRRAAQGYFTVEEATREAIRISDNTAANLLMRAVGGPARVTDFFRSVGDDVTRLDRDEPMLNENRPGDPRDTTTPRAMAHALSRTLSGPPLTPGHRHQLADWMVATENGRDRLRGGLPAEWLVGDKPGTGPRGACHDVAVVWPDGREATPWFVAAYLSDSDAAPRDLLEAQRRIGTIVADVIRRV